jgi:hypothetical protein
MGLRLIQLAAGGGGRALPLDKPLVVLGRAGDCDVVLDSPNVSRRHCAMKVCGESLAVKDLDSANGTYVNGCRVGEAVLEAGDRLRVGSFRFLVQSDEPEALATEGAGQETDGGRADDLTGALVDLAAAADQMADAMARGTRPGAGPTRHCKSCNGPLEVNANFCPHCGAMLQDAVLGADRDRAAQAKALLMPMGGPIVVGARPDAPTAGVGRPTDLWRGQRIVVETSRWATILAAAVGSLNIFAGLFALARCGTMWLARGSAAFAGDDLPMTAIVLAGGSLGAGVALVIRAFRPGLGFFRAVACLWGGAALTIAVGLSLLSIRQALSLVILCGAAGAALLFYGYGTKKRYVQPRPPGVPRGSTGRT